MPPDEPSVFLLLLKFMFAHTRLGKEHGQRLVAALAAGPDRVFELIQRHAIDCAAERNGWVLGAHKPDAADELKTRASYWAERGAAVSFHQRRETATLTGSERYSACLFERRSGGINSLAYTRGLVLAARDAGADIFEHSAAVEITSGRHARWCVTTAEGAIEANHVVHCTNAYTGKLWQGLAKTIVPLRAYALVTDPLSDDLQHTVLPGG